MKWWQWLLIAVGVGLGGWVLYRLSQGDTIETILDDAKETLGSGSSSGSGESHSAGNKCGGDKTGSLSCIARKPVDGGADGAPPAADDKAIDDGATGVGDRPPAADPPFSRGATDDKLPPGLRDRLGAGAGAAPGIGTIPRTAIGTSGPASSARSGRAHF